MKKLLSLILFTVLIISNCLSVFAYADVDFDITKYSYEELAEIQRMIANYFLNNPDGSAQAPEGPVEATDATEQPNEQEPQGVVLYDSDGVYIEYRGILKKYPGLWKMDLYIDNTHGTEIYITMDDERVNDRFSVPIGNAFCSVPNNTICLSDLWSASIFRIDTNTIKAYGANSLNTLEFKLKIRETSGEYKTIAEIPITLNINMPID